MGTLMRDFHMSPMAALSLPINQAFALLAWNCETHPWAKFERTSPGYIAQAASQTSPTRPTSQT
jgi:hypothetical protein